MRRGEVVLLPKGSACAECGVKAGCFPLLTFEQWCEQYHNNSVIRKASDDAYTRHTSGDMAGLRQCSATGMQQIGMRIEAPFLMLNAKEATQVLGVVPDAIGATPVEIETEGGKESVVLFRDTTLPRKAILYIDHGNQLQEPLMAQLLREGQAQDTFRWASDLMMKDQPAGLKKRLQVMTIAQAKQKAQDYKANLDDQEGAAQAKDKCQDDDDAAAPANVISSLPSWMAKPTLEAAGGKKDKRKPGKTTLVSRVASVGAATQKPSARSSTQGARGSSGSSIVLDLMNPLPPNIGTSSCRRVADTASVASGCTTATKLLGAPKSSYFNLQDIMLGLADTRTITGERALVAASSHAGRRAGRCCIALGIGDGSGSQSPIGQVCP